MLMSLTQHKLFEKLSDEDFYSGYSHIAPRQIHRSPIQIKVTNPKKIIFQNTVKTRYSRNLLITTLLLFFNTRTVKENQGCRKLQFERVGV